MKRKGSQGAVCKELQLRGSFTPGLDIDKILDLESML